MPSTSLGHPSLLPLRNALFLGSYGTVVSRALQVNIDPSDEDYKSANIEKDTLIYRAQIGQAQYDVVLSDIEESDQTHIALRAVRLLARYFATGNDRGKQLVVIDQLDAYLGMQYLLLTLHLQLSLQLFICKKRSQMKLWNMYFHHVIWKCKCILFVKDNNIYIYHHFFSRAALKVICYLQMNLLSEAIEAQKNALRNER